MSNSTRSRAYIARTKRFIPLGCALSFVFAILSCGGEHPSGQQVLSLAERDSSYSYLSDEQRRMPSYAVEGLEVAEGLDVTLFAAEPQLLNPTNMDIDSRGRVWITEAYNYRPSLNPSNPQRPEGDRIVILEDLDGDGRADTTKVFYQGSDINAPLGIAVLGEKVIVSCSPNVYVFTDSNGDDIPDKKEILFSGIGGEQHDHAIHAFVFGPDGKLYFNYGNAGAQLQDGVGNTITDINGYPVIADGKPFREGMVFRVNPDGTELEVLANNFRNNYEVALDSYGTLWQSDNDDDGNRGVRINYVMEYGNYGYKDEKTGASWQAQRTNMEAEIPLRHWHLNDPGVVPNLLQTGAGSPTGILVYEGELLPEIFRNQMIHADAGPNVVRAYPVKDDGAGYSADIVNILEGARDQWFRPSDVTIAPDGSLFVADWYDPGVGGHQMGDMNRGRIYRIAPHGATYNNGKISVASAQDAVKALQSPNMAVRYKAWMALNEFGEAAKPALETLWEQQDNPRFRARALWLLARLADGEKYIRTAIADKDANIRITGLRAARQGDADLVPYLEVLVHDKSPQVRREAAIALRYCKSEEAADLWTELALQHDGKDRWYLEALGIAAEGRWDSFFKAWVARAQPLSGTAAENDIIWRARTSLAMPLLAARITDPGIPTNKKLRYFRAFDFQDPAGAAQKEDILIGLLNTKLPDREQITQLALNHLNPATVISNTRARDALNKTLASEDVRGTQVFVNLVDRYQLKNRNRELLQIMLAYPDSTMGTQAARLLLGSGGEPLLKKTLNGKNEDTLMSALHALEKVQNVQSADLINDVIQDEAQPGPVREQAVRSLAWGWSGDDRLLDLVKRGELPEEYESVAAGVLSQSFRQGIRDEAAKYLTLETTTGGEEAMDIEKLLKLHGETGPGEVLSQQLCQTCHVIRGKGHDFGPELSQIGSKLPKEAIYESIINPDAGISFGFEGSELHLKDGSTLVGIVYNETSELVSVKMPAGAGATLRKEEIAGRTAMDHSMMPSNLANGLSEQQMANLVEYLYALK